MPREIQRPKIHLIPGTMCDERLWSRLRPLLEETYELVHLPIPRNKNFSQLAEYFAEKLDDPVNLLGFSLGGYIAAWFAQRYPHKVQRLFVVANNLSELPEQEVETRSRLLDWVEKHGYGGMSYKKAASLLDASQQNNSQQDALQKNKQLISLIRDMEKSLGEAEFISQHSYTTQRENLLAPDSTLTGHAFTDLALACPTYLFFSEKDPLMACDWLDQNWDTLKNIKIITVPGSGHMLPLEQPEQLACAIRQWLAQEME